MSESTIRQQTFHFTCERVWDYLDHYWRSVDSGINNVTWYQISETSHAGGSTSPVETIAYELSFHIQSLIKEMRE